MEFIPSSAVKCLKSGFLNNHWVSWVGQRLKAVFESHYYVQCIQCIGQVR